MTRKMMFYCFVMLDRYAIHGLILNCQPHDTHLPFWLSWRLGSPMISVDLLLIIIINNLLCVERPAQKVVV